MSIKVYPIVAFCGLLAACAPLARAADEHVLHRFEKIQLSDQFFSEGADFGDLNRDGHMDVVSGPYWYQGPDFAKRHEYYPAAAFHIDGYSNNFFTFTYDVDRDGWTDVIVYGFPGAEAWWFQNPQGAAGHWRKHLILPVVDNESPNFVDVTGDDRPEVVCSVDGRLGYAEIPASDVTSPWKFTPVTPKRDYQRFTHGLGVGDVNNDGRMDLLEKNGWWEQPPDSQDPWTFHAYQFSEPGGAQMLVLDIDGDGDNDVISSKAAHAYGLSWFENVAEKDGEVRFEERPIMGERPEQNEYGVAFSQLHALALADMNQDGVDDLITGKRFWAHKDQDPGSLEPAVLYWFEIVRDEQQVRFVPHRIDSNSGVGTQIVAGDISGDGLPDIVVGNKKGTFVFRHEAKIVDEADWKKAQPQPRSAQSDAQHDHASHDHAGQATTEVAPLADDGRVLNLDFETGDLTDWTATGNAFDGQPIKGDTIHRRRADSVSGHKGDYWIGTYEINGDGAQGTLTSVPFEVTHPYASFRVGGGAGPALRAEIVRADTDEVIFQSRGKSLEEMLPVVVDLRAVVGEQIFLRIVDHGATGWGHINFDHFRFHPELPEFEADRRSLVSAADEYPYAGLPAEEAARVMQLPAGFKVVASAAEPDVRQPIAMAIDDRGRVWVAEAYEYPLRAPEGEGRDRILIFEDHDGDGRFDERKIFAENLNLVSGLEVGFGGVWVGAAPYLLFIPDRDGDDVPDAEPQILLDGWAYQDTHETLNTFIWGPDGWLYGCHGVFTHSRVGKPGTPDAERIPLNAAIWRYHPTRHEFEIFAEGTSNPWGVDFDDHGQAFCTACVIPHLYHVIQGARYQRQAGSHFNRYTYADIRTIADHLHYLGESSHARNDSSGAAGGGHAHSGAMIYLGGKWPEHYRGRIFMNNIHGQRLNTDILKPSGSGFVGSHGPDFLLSGDLASQILNIRYGPDGDAYFIDWYDTNACHHNNVEGHDRSNGRVFKVVYGAPRPVSIDLKTKSDLELAELVLEQNDWYVRHARRLLQERADRIDPKARERLAEILTEHSDAKRRLRALWALHVAGGIPKELESELLADRDEYVRAWTIQLLAENGLEQSVLPQLAAMAHDDLSPVVRLYIASALQRISPHDRWPIVEALVSHSEDAQDHNLPLMYWYASEPLAAIDPARALRLGLSCRSTIPVICDYMLRRIGDEHTAESLELLVSALKDSESHDEQLVLLEAVESALTGQRQASPPASWNAAFKRLSQSPSAAVRSEATIVGVRFGDESALDSLRKLVANREANAAQRHEALDALLAARDAGLATTLHALLDQPALRNAAISGLAAYDDPNTPAILLEAYPSLTAGEKRAALATLASRPAYALALLQAVAQEAIPVTDLSADLVRQLHNLKNPDVDELLVEIWGQVRSTDADKAELINRYRRLVTKTPHVEPDPELGRAVFAKTCQQCHTLYGVGEKIGPDLTGSNRSDIEYLLSNIVDPAALISKEYQSTVILTVDGRVVTGIVVAEDEQSVTVRTATETIVIPQDEIDDRQLSDTSMMPEDQLKQFSEHEIISLFAYLRGKSQTPIAATKDNASQFFNGSDLTGWSGESGLWSVENGEIIGRSAGLAHNSFLLSDFSAGDFRLTFEVKLVADVGNSGVQFRSTPLEGFHEVRGYQADIGPGWWGKLYEENGRALLWDQSGEAHVKKDDWNRYEIEAVGTRIRTWINGNLCVDLEDPEGARRGIFALQLHSGGPMEVRFRNLKLEVK